MAIDSTLLFIIIKGPFYAAERVTRFIYDFLKFSGTGLYIIL